jgi:hypothetical protein
MIPAGIFLYAANYGANIRARKTGGEVAMPASVAELPFHLVAPEGHRLRNGIDFRNIICNVVPHVPT